jgi:hypothetical protein
MQINARQPNMGSSHLRAEPQSGECEKPCPQMKAAGKSKDRTSLTQHKGAA